MLTRRRRGRILTLLFALSQSHHSRRLRVILFSACHSTKDSSHAKVSIPRIRAFLQDAVLTTPLIRTGLTGDVFGRLIKRTALNPAFTLALVLLARYTKQGSELALLHPTALSRIHKLLYFGIFRWVSGWLDAGVLDNWKKDNYDWEKEVVLVTGGAGGIGGQVVKLFAEKNIKVVVLDVIPMTFEARKSMEHFLSSQARGNRGSIPTSAAIDLR